MDRLCRGLTAALLLLSAPPGPAAADPAERAYRLAADLLREDKPALAAEALDRFVLSFPDSGRIDDALYLRATVAFPPREPERLRREHAAGAAEARAFLERIRAGHATGDRAPEATYLLGLTHLVPQPLAAAGGDPPGHDPERALALFREVLQIYPGSGAGPAALRGSAVAALRAGRPGAALLFLERLLLQRPTGPLAEAARLAAADAWLRLGEREQALVALSAATSAAAADRVAAILRPGPVGATAWRREAGWPGAVGGFGAVESMATDAAGRLHLLAGGALLRLGADGSVQERREVDDARCLFREPGGGIGWASESEVHLPTGSLAPQRTDDGRARKVDGLTDVVQAPDGTLYLLAGRSVLRFHADGTFAAVAAEPRDPVALAVDRRGHLYVLDGKERRVAAYGPDGRPTVTFDAGELRGPVDLAIDDAYHLYVLGRSDGGFEVFAPSGERRARVRPEGLRAPEHLALERDGAVVVFEAKGKMLRRFR